MASIYAAIRKILGDDPAVVALVPLASIQMFQNTSTALPGIVIYSPSGELTEDLDKGAAFPWTRRISLDIRAKDYSKAHEVGEAVLSAFNGYQGTVEGNAIDRAFLIGDIPLLDEQVGVSRRVMDFRVVYQPA